MDDPRSRLPAVHRMLSSLEGRHLVDRYGHAVVREAVREVLVAARRGLAGDDRPPSPDLLWREVQSHLERGGREAYPGVINATGVLIHTNLGRAPRIDAAPPAYLALEMDLESGGRGERLAPVTQRVCRYFGAEAATVVTNNAAALVLLLAAHGAGREVLVSRGELIEIGGSFRLPEIMAAAGARLVEVGCTNRTRADDYRRAISDSTAAILVVHRSNFSLGGFVETPDPAELAVLAHQHGLPLWVDQGSGCHCDLSAFGLRREATVQELLGLGADAVLFSGDKLLGGAQAGVVVGREATIAPLRRHPLRRALRPDKSALVALAATLDAFLAHQPHRVPLYRLLAESEASLRRRARRLARRVAERVPGVRAVPCRGVLGGGTTPDQTLASWAVQLPDRREVAARLRLGEPPVIARSEGGWLLVDLRAVSEEQDRLLEAALLQACTSPALALRPQA